MDDDFAEDSALNGTWEGYYDYDNKIYSAKNYPIAATSLQTGKRFRGIMIDGTTDTEVSIQRLVEAYQGRKSAGALRRARRTLEQFPDLSYESSLPEESRIEGKIVGDTVRFTNTYLGTHSLIKVEGSDRALVQTINNHRVDYRGSLILQDATIEGRWFIYWRGLLGRILPPLSSGGFQLFKKM